MKIEDFSYLRCLNCRHVIIVPISYDDNHTLLSNMCTGYSELNECCNDADVAFASVKFGIEEGCIKITDLPLALRKEFPPRMTHEFAGGKHSLFITKYDGTKIIISTNGINLTIDDGNLPFVYELMGD